jgi:FdhD protein
MMKIDTAPVPLIVPNPGDPRLTERVAGTDQTGAAVEINVPVERPLTLYLNAQEIVTMMTIGDYPEYLALGYLLNQNMLKYDDVVTEVEYDDDLQVVVVGRKPRAAPRAPRSAISWRPSKASHCRSRSCAPRGSTR